MLKITGVPQEVGERLVSLQGEKGDLQPEVVVEDARDPGSPTHGYFTWDDTEAARKQRLSEAANLIRRVRVQVIDVPAEEVQVKVEVRKYIATEELDGKHKGYREVESLAVEDDGEMVLQSIKRDIERLRRKYEGYEALFNLLLRGDAAA